jgi:hypothetical protein
MLFAVIILLQIFFVLPASAGNINLYTEKIQCKFNSASSFYTELAIVEVGKNQAVIDKTGNYIIPPGKYSFPQSASNDQIFANRYIVAGKNGRYGLVDRKGKILVPMKYEYVSAINKEYALVANGQGFSWSKIDDPRFGLVRISDGKEILSPKYYKIVFNATKALMTVIVNNSTYCLMNMSGKTIASYSFIGEFSDNRALVDKNNKYGAVDESGKLIIPLKYDWIGNFYNGTATFDLNNKYGLIDKNGNILVKPQFEDGSIYPNGYAAFKNKDSLFWYVYDKTGKLAFKRICDGVPEYVNGIFLCISDKNENSYEWSAVDTKGNVVVPFKDYQLSASDNLKLIHARQNVEETALLDFKGNEVIPFDKHTLITFKNIDLIEEIKDSKYGIYNSSGKVIFPHEYDMITISADRYLIIQKAGKYALANVKGDIIIPFGKYDLLGDVSVFSDDHWVMLPVKKNGLWGYASFKDF